MSTKLTRTNSGGSSGTKWTRSLWLKRGALGASQTLCAAGSYITFTSSDYIEVLDSAGVGMLVTNRKFRDPAAWYHIVLTYDSTAGSSDRLILYVNGVRETSFSTNSQPALNQVDTATNNGQVQYIGTRTGSNYYFLGYMAHVYFTDGYAYPASSFGETDSTSGIWVPKLSASVSYGTNGYFLKFASGATGTDSSGQSNTMTVAGNLTSPKDNPQHNFCTLNPLDVNINGTNALVYSNGNTTVAPIGNNWKNTVSTMGAMTGKYYFEAKITGSGLSWWVGIMDPSEIQYYSGNKKQVAYPRGYGFNLTFDKGNNASEVSWGYNTSIAQNDIVCVAVDLTNSKIYVRKNGDAWANTTASPAGDPTSGATGTGSAYTLAQNGGNNINYVPAISCYAWNGEVTCNFGAGYFGTTAVASEGTNASGVGTFEFDVPTGYTAFSTKGLNI